MEERTSAAVVDSATSDGIYVYCIIESTEPRGFGPIVIGGQADEVYTIHYRDLAAVVSRAPLQVYGPTRVNARTHEQRAQRLVRERVVALAERGQVRGVVGAAVLEAREVTDLEPAPAVALTRR